MSPEIYGKYKEMLEGLDEVEFTYKEVYI